MLSQWKLAMLLLFWFRFLLPFGFEWTMPWAILWNHRVSLWRFPNRHLRCSLLHGLGQIWSGQLCSPSLLIRQASPWLSYQQIHTSVELRFPNVPAHCNVWQFGGILLITLVGKDRPLKGVSIRRGVDPKIDGTRLAPLVQSRVLSRVQGLLPLSETVSGLEVD